MSSQPTASKVSLCIPTFNGAEYLAAAIESALAQDYPDLEILVVDDGSTDGTLAIAAELLGGNPRARVVTNADNVGLVGNWNRCLELAEGDFVKFLFQDDLLTPDCISKMVAAASGNEKVVVCRKTLRVEPKSDPDQAAFLTRLQEDIAATWPEGVSLSGEELASEALRLGLDRNFYGEPTAVLLRRSHWKTMGMFEPQFRHFCDLEMMLRVAGTFGFHFIPEPLCTFRVHGASATFNNMSQYRSSTMCELLSLLSLIRNDPRYAPYRSTPRKRLELRRNEYRMMGWIAQEITDYGCVPDLYKAGLKRVREAPFKTRVLNLLLRGQSRLYRLFGR